MENNKKLKEAFIEALGINEEEVVNDLKYQSIPQWDSISHMVLISEIEDVFDIDIDTEDVIALSSYAKAKEILQKNYQIDF